MHGLRPPAARHGGEEAARDVPAAAANGRPVAGSNVRLTAGDRRPRAVGNVFLSPAHRGPRTTRAVRQTAADRGDVAPGAVVEPPADGGTGRIARRPCIVTGAVAESAADRAEIVRHHVGPGRERIHVRIASAADRRSLHSAERLVDARAADDVGRADRPFEAQGVHAVETEDEIGAGAGRHDVRGQGPIHPRAPGNVKLGAGIRGADADAIAAGGEVNNGARIRPPVLGVGSSDGAEGGDDRQAENERRNLSHVFSSCPIG
jgi:hypothetical protein